MSLCPHCHEPHGISEVRVWLSAPLWPAKCSKCQARFCPARVRSVVVTEIAFLPFGLMTTSASSNVWVAALFILGFLVAYLAVRALVPLVELPTPQAGINR